MTRPNPKFCVSEEVMVRSIEKPQYNTDRVEILRCEWRGHRGWAYILAHTPPDVWVLEHTLRKIPPEDRLSFSDCVWQPNEDIIDG